MLRGSIDRGQTTLFPECLADWMSEGNLVRVIDAFVDKLDLSRLGFERVVAEATGDRPIIPPCCCKRVFISYSRMDMAFAHKLEVALKARGFRNKMVIEFVILNTCHGSVSGSTL